jgi:hypothetical protein
MRGRVLPRCDELKAEVAMGGQTAAVAGAHWELAGALDHGGAGGALDHGEAGVPLDHGGAGGEP